MRAVQPAAGRYRAPSLRLTAFRFDLSGAENGPAERFPCEHLCRRGGSACLDPETQAARNCARPGFDRRAWTGELFRAEWMGKRPRLDVDERGAEEFPREDPEDGCPGSAYRTPWIGSLLKYRRRPDGNGGRVPNRLLDLCTDELVLEAIEALEAYEDEWSSRWQRAAMARLRKE